jgi:LuxR family maltose regulon positive regulatory protein
VHARRLGKTTLLADWAARATLPVAWLSLDPDDNDPVRFWRHVATALDRVVGGLGEQLVPLLSPGSGTSTQGVVTALINQLEANPDEVALVLDDYHAIESTVILDSLGFLLSHLPPRLHLAIASEPGSFACWRVDLSHQGGGRWLGSDRPVAGIWITGRWTPR